MTPAQYIEAARVPRHLKPWKDGNRNFQFVKARGYQLLMKYRRYAKVQGAWAFPREFAKRWPDRLLGAPK